MIEMKIWSEYRTKIKALSCESAQKNRSQSWQKENIWLTMDMTSGDTPFHSRHCKPAGEKDEDVEYGTEPNTENNGEGLGARLAPETPIVVERTGEAQVQMT